VKIVCLVKQVPRSDSIEFDQETKSLRREGVPLVLNPFDAAAVVQAAQLTQETGGEVIAMTMGPPQAHEALRTCLALGADRCIHLSDRAFAVADTIGTSRTLALAIRREGGVDLVLCGRKSLDSETWQVPPETAAFLGWPHLTSVVGIAREDGGLRAARETDDGDETYELDGPAVLSLARAVESEDTADGPVEVWTASHLVDDLREHDKRFGQTGSPTRVLAVRDVTPERSGERVDTVDEAAALMTALLAERGPEPTSWDKPDRLGEKPGESYDCWTLVELAGGRPTRVARELLAKGRELSGKLGGDNVALLLGHKLEAAGREAARSGADRVVIVDDAKLADHHPELSAHALRKVVERERPHVLLVPATANGRDIGPRVAGDLELGMTGDCVGLGIDRAGRLIQTKPAYGGNIVSVIMGSTTPQLATVRPRMFAPLEPRDVDVPIEGFDVGTLPEPNVRAIGRRDAPARDLDECDTVVCLGPAVPAVPDLPDTVAVGGTREACERGLLHRNRQIGAIGRPVAPRVLVAVEVPGNVEELIGFVKANVIVALNSDADSPMLAAADVGLVGDPNDLLPRLLGAI
jgi:electron transfer flavoprotein alpha subunit